MFYEMKRDNSLLASRYYKFGCQFVSRKKRNALIDLKTLFINNTKSSKFQVNNELHYPNQCFRVFGILKTLKKVLCRLLRTNRRK